MCACSCNCTVETGRRSTLSILFSSFPPYILKKGVCLTVLEAQLSALQGLASYLCLSGSWPGTHHCHSAFIKGVRDLNFMDWATSLHLQSAFDLSTIIIALESLFYFMILLSILYSRMPLIYSIHYGIHSDALYSICCQVLLTLAYIY